MYRSTAKRVKRASVWAATAALSVGAGVFAANIASVGSSLTAAPTTLATTPAPTTATSPAASTAATPAAPAAVQTVALTTSAPTPRTVLAVSAHSLTVRGASGPITYTLTPSTVILSGTSHVSVSSIHAGSRVIVVPTSANASVAGTIGILPSSGSGERESNSGGFDD